MDAEHVRQLLESQQRLIESFIQNQQAQQQQSGSTVTSSRTFNTALLPNSDNYDSTKESFSNYKQRFENYVQMKKVSSDKKYCAQLILNSIGAINFNIISPKQPSELTYAELMEMLEKHLAPKRNILVVQHQFLSKCQTNEQNIADFIAVIHIALNEPVLKAIALESSKADSKALSQKSQDGGTSTTVVINKNLPGEEEHKQSSRAINYKELGIDNLSLGCGGNNHLSPDCRTEKSNLHCSGCQATGHVIKVCISTLLKRKKEKSNQSSNHSATKQISTYPVPDQREDTDKLCRLYGVVSQIVNLKQEAVNGLTKRYYAQIRIGTKVVEFEVNPGAAYSFLPRNEYAGLNLGFGLDLLNLDTHATDVSTVKLIDTIENMDQVVQMYPVLCNGKIGKIPDIVVSLKHRKGAQPVFHRELIPKADGGVRLCVDYKVGVNEWLQDAHYPNRKIDDILISLRNSRFFCRLDLVKAYLHVPVDEQSREIQTIYTHRGTYRLHRLSFGIKTAPSEFNRIIEQILRDVPKTMSYFDYIIVHRSTREECQHNLIAYLDQLQKFDLHLNQPKCSLFQEQIEYLGHFIEINKISKSPGKVAAIVDMPRPKSAEDVRIFLGMNTIFKWASACEAALLKLKQAIASDQVLVPYDPDLAVQLACDASPTGIGGVLSHIVDGHEHPIAFASRSLTAAEQNYSQLDRKALTIVFTVDHFFQYLFGHHFKLVTDNQPLTRIFNHQATLPKMTAGRLERYAAIHSGFNYTYDFKKGIINSNFDCLSRAPVNINSYTASAIDNEVKQLCEATSEQIRASRLPAKVPSHPWEEPEHNWQRIHIDYADPYQVHNFLVVIDAKSKWAEIVTCSSPPTSKPSIKILKDRFSRNEFPEVMVSDNAMIFTTGHPATNGLAEHNVQMLKHRLSTMSNQNMPIRQKVWEILFSLPGYTLSNGKFPAEQPIKFHESPAPTQPARQFSEGERVSARYYSNNKAHWKCGKVLKKLGKLHYLVEIDNGFHFKRHIDQLRSTEVRFQPDMVLPEAEQPDPIEQEEEAPVVDLQQPEQPAQRERPQRECRLPAYLRDYSLY
ncbi:hypothetical protein PR048_019450 [Dryococelus australis]|uniref:Reverse transcriptase domain-containing protein n=1 Tax=Dryococelus australis TaxID=614101 RepID=A0ABQ9H3J0_9NEOP|nr:hypothetical protein PR048_019450 [Dryococelus australis]